MLPSLQNSIGCIVELPPNFHIKDEPIDFESCIVTKEEIPKHEIVVKEEPREIVDILIQEPKKLQKRFAYDEKGFLCQKCRKTFKILANFEAHQCSYGCTVCGKTFARRDNLQQHQIYVHDQWLQQDLFTCDHCGKGFKYRKSLICHMKQHMKVLPLVCNICSEGFSVNNTYRQHMLTHGGKVPCKMCGKMLKPSALYYHMKQTHGTERNFHCTLCPSAFKTKSDLTNHMCSHDKKFKCEICSKRFSKAFALRKHLILHTNSIVFKCEHCTKTFSRQDSLYHHTTNVHGITLGKSKIQLRTHVNNEHEQKAPTVVLKRKILKDEDSNQSIMKIVPANQKIEPTILKVVKNEPTIPKVVKSEPKERKGDNEMWIPCKDCNQAFLSARNLRIHQLKMHSRSTKCEICAEEFDSKREVIKHINFAHKL